MDSFGLLVFLLAGLGFVILIAELFVPSAGLLTMLATTCFVGSAYCAWRAWYETGHYAWWWSYVMAMIILLPSVIVGGLYWVPRTSWGREIFAAPQSLEELTPFQEEEARLAELIHHRGKALTLFSPGGMALIGKEKFHAESEGVLIEPGDEVVVVSVKANRLVVRPAALYDAVQPRGSEIASQRGETSRGSPATGSSIDFDIPETA